MSARARTLYVGLDACDLHMAQQFAAEGAMPTLARLLETAAVQETMGPLGFVVGGNWVTSYTGTSPSRHQFLCSGQVRGGTYEPRWVGPYGHNPAGGPTPVWQWVSDAGGRVAVLDAPHAGLNPDLNGVQLVEWGAHDRHAATCSHPESLLGEINEKYGAHIGTRAAEIPHHAPCDVSHREGNHRTLAENQRLLDEFLHGARQKGQLSRDLLDQGGWDLFFTVFGESHCVGHQFWKMHDETHPWHDPEECRALGGDPIRAIYSALDRELGELLEHVGEDTTVYVHLSHGMRSHYDGTCVLDPVLWRIDEYASQTDQRGLFTRALDNAANFVPRSMRQSALSSVFDVRRRLTGRSGPIGTDGRTVDIPPWMGERRWWMQPNDSVFGSVRLNLDGREPNGRIRAQRKRAAAEWLGDRLLELINVDTGLPAVAAVYFTDDYYERVDGDPMGDVVVEWNRDAPIDTVWSPATGVVTAPYLQWRTGDHHRAGLLLASGPGITPGRRSGEISILDVAPTLAASLGIEPPAIDGIARADLVPADERATVVRRSKALAGPLLSDKPMHPKGRRPYARGAFDLRAEAWVQKFAVGLSQALHAENAMIQDLRNETGALDARVDDVERLARIAQVSAWLRHVDVPESLLVSVVMPTRNRLDVVERAIESVRRQSYANWELLVVDDASTDDTWARLEKLAANDPRIRVFRKESRVASSRARNFALDLVQGDVVTYLDDDNRFDPDWLRSVAWAFTEYPETQVAYGARVVDDDVRHMGLSGRSLPIVQFLAWDPAAMLNANRVDQNVIAHRPSDVRFDEEITIFNDWDLMLQLTDNCDPLELPAIAVHYYSDSPNRMTDIARAEASEQRYAARVRERARGAPDERVNPKTLCTSAYGRHVELFDVTGPALARYAERHGYELVVLHERLARGRPAAWDKVVFLHSLVADSDLVVWVDCDALVLDDVPDIADELDPDRYLHLVEHRTDAGRVPNTGVLALRGGERSAQFLEQVWSQQRFVHDRWWENAAVNHVLGYRHVRGVRPVVPSRWRSGIGFLDRKWNSIPDDPAPDPYIVHFPGIALDDRLRELSRYAAPV